MDIPFSRDVSAKEKLIANSNNVLLIGEEFFMMSYSSLILGGMNRSGLCVRV